MHVLSFLPIDPGQGCVAKASKVAIHLTFSKGMQQSVSRGILTVWIWAHL